MPTLEELKNRWFIPIGEGSGHGVPNRRHTEDAGINTLEVSTDGNLVTPLIDGSNFMREWHDRLTALTTGSGDRELFHANWRFEGVKTLGNSVSGNDALEDVDDAEAAGVATYVLTCRNAMVLVFNNPTIIWLRLHGVWTTCMDNRFPAGGSNHHKFAVHKSGSSAVAVLGSIDISKTRWDRPAHAPVDPDRHPWGGPTHDTGVLLQGPAVVDVERSYRERWNDSTRTFGMEPLAPPQPLISTPLSAPAATGTHSVQVLRTYGITNTFFGYSWSPRGEFTVWASYLNAFARAERYLYIEDQYFLPFDWPPCFSRSGAARNTDLIYQLGEAMKRGVNVCILTPSNAEDSTHVFQKYQRDIGVNYLLSVRAAGSPGDVVVASLQNSGTDVYIHSKLLIADDEFVAIGSTNVGQRSMTHDGELHIGVVDGDNLFARELRKTLWAEHTSRSAASLDDPAAAFLQFKADTAASHGHLKPYPVDPLSVFPATPGSTPPPRGHARLIRNLVDPYAGPPGIR